MVALGSSSTSTASVGVIRKVELVANEGTVSQFLAEFVIGTGALLSDVLSGFDTNFIGSNEVTITEASGFNTASLGGGKTPCTVGRIVASRQAGVERTRAATVGLCVCSNGSGGKEES